ncbi:type I CRISPR-associated protein Cas7 [Clostridium sp. CF011]|uniref:type I CRISPR-associated protein Cas7 n=1 Tax=Clostridium sp. CF011 TaxID=2843318 RepID=UPI001C0B7EDD|nr:type I CRISPR-associated protein Cas7 [Clostridium sp. CF011]MBU3092740.1 type I CRISPR-associated protein Cas7 [Clostridium sp. CF011]WAG71161.1 type I CRISPR-associated protein Cas7 [Clostridium sp. CF011]
MEMIYNVFGLIGVRVNNANWNAGFDKLPKRDGNDVIKGSTYALQYCIKNQWLNRGERVLGIKTLRANGGCNKLSERYFDLFEEEDKKVDNKDSEEIKQKKIGSVVTNLLSCKDVNNFGVAYTGVNSMSIKGVVQFTDGINKYEDTNIVEEQILSPYANPKKGDVTRSTLGTKYTTDEAHYVYDFSVFPKEYNKYKINGFKGYTEEDYKDFKMTSLIAVSNYNSKAKAGCKNEFAMFIEAKEECNYLLDLNYLQEYVKVYKEDKVVYDLTSLGELLNKVVDKIKNIEIYYNFRTIEVKGMIESNLVKNYDLITREEL